MSNLGSRPFVVWAAESRQVVFLRLLFLRDTFRGLQEPAKLDERRHMLATLRQERPNHRALESQRALAREVGEPEQVIDLEQRTLRPALSSGLEPLSPSEECPTPSVRRRVPDGAERSLRHDPFRKGLARELLTHRITSYVREILAPLVLVVLVALVGAVEPRVGLYAAALGALAVSRWPA